jgi:hypothetical protein
LRNERRIAGLSHETEPVQVVYILGTSYSGSTILGYLLDLSKKLCNIGEMKFFNRVRKMEGISCTCGEAVLNCPFWSRYFKKEYAIFETPGFFRWVGTVVEIAFFEVSGGKKIENSGDYLLLKDLFRDVSAVNPETVYLLDTSKSLWRLFYLMQCRFIELKVICLTREIQGNVYSFMKHGFGFWSGLLIYKANNFLIRRFLKKSGLAFVALEYES